MEAHTIDLLAAEMGDTMPSSSATLRFAGSDVEDMARRQFLGRYRDMHFGWKAADWFSRRGREFPIPMLDRDAWVFKAYMMLVDPRNCFDRSVGEAFMMNVTATSNVKFGEKLKALLVSVRHPTAVEHFRDVEKRTGIPYDTIEAFESLFFNIVDRMEDGAYLAENFYPDTRIVEFSDKYLDTTRTGELLKRAGYNYRDMEFTTFLSGLGDASYLNKIASSIGSEKELEKKIIGNGLLLSKTNLLNQRSLGLSRVANLMAASRRSGMQTENPSLSEVVTLFNDSYEQAIGVSRETMLEQLRLDAGMQQTGAVVDV
jgi:hypothetical protein